MTSLKVILFFLLSHSPFYLFGQTAVTIPDSMIIKGESFQIPINISGVNGEVIGAYDLELSFDENIITPAGGGYLKNGSLSKDFSIAANNSISGKLLLSAADARGFSEDGVLIYLTFESVNEGNSEITFEKLFFNEGSPKVNTENGIITIANDSSGFIPNSVTLISPSNEQALKTFTPDFAWSNSDLADEYIFVLSLDSVFISTVIEDSVSVSSYTGVDRLAENSTYYWRVKAKNEFGYSDWSSRFTFFTETEVSTEREGLPINFKLEQNYPNPFNPSTVIQYGIPSASEVRLEIFSMLGQKLETLVNETKSAGWHTATFDASGLSSGFYIYRIQAGSFVSTKKLMLIK